MTRKLLLPIISLLLALCFVLPALADGEFAFDKTVTELFEGATLQTVLNRSGEAAEGEVSYTTSAPKVATVDENGLVTGLKKGTVTITAKCGKDKAKIKLTVLRPMTGITVNEKNLMILQQDDPALEGIVHQEEVAEGEMPASVLVLRRGKSAALTLTAVPSDASSKKMIITSSDEEIVRVKDKTLTARDLGECEIIISSVQNPEVTLRYRVLVVEPITAIKLTADETSTYVGGTLTLNADVKPSEATLQTLVWTSSKDSIATVDQHGVVSGIAKGSVTITAKATDGSGKSATYKVTVRQQVTDVVLDEDDITVNVGSYKTLKATVYPKDANNKKLIWTSSNEAIAKVNKEGRVTPVAPGVCTITCTSEDVNDVYAVCQVTVQQPVTKVAFEGSSASVSKGSDLQLYWTTSPDTATDTSVSFTTSKQSVATVDENGVVTGVSKGTATITIMAEDGSKKKDTIEITVTQPVEGMTLDLTDVTVNVGSYKTLKANILPTNANNKKVTWVSSNEAIAKVNSAGKITPVAPGVCTITAISQDNPEVTAACVVTILQPVTKVVLSDSTLNFDVNTVAQLYWSVEPYNASNQDVIFTSSDERIATVDQNGLVYGVKRGSATITVTAADGSKKKDTIKVNILQPVLGVHMQETNLRVGVDESIRARAILEPEDASNTNMTWASNDPYIVEVRGTNTRPSVTGKRWGSAVITGITEDGGYATYFIVDVGDYDYALRINDVYLSDNDLKINTYNESNLNITRFNMKLELYDIYNQPLPCTTFGTNEFVAGNAYTLLPGETTRRGSYYFYDYVKPATDIGHVIAYVTDYQTEDGYYHYIKEDKLEKIEYYSPLYVGPEGLLPVEPPVEVPAEPSEPIEPMG